MSQDKGHTPKRQSSNPSDDAALKALKEKLEAKRRANIEIERQRPKGNSNLGKGVRYASEFTAAMFVGTGGGLIVDWFFPTSPWGLFVGLILGFAAGILNVTRAAKAGMQGDLGQDLLETEEEDA